MNRKISLGVALTIVLIVSAICGFVCYNIVDKKYDSVVEGMPEKMERYELLDQVDGIIKNNYYGEINKNDLSDSLIKGYINALGDSNSSYMTKDELAEQLGLIS